MRLIDEKVLDIITSFAHRHNLKITVDTSLWDEYGTVAPYPQIQINFHGPHIVDWAFFYGVNNDNEINVSSIYQFEYFEMAEAMCKEFKKYATEVVQSCIIDDDDNTIHLYSKYKLEDFKNEYIEEWYNFLQSDFGERLALLVQNSNC